MASQPQGHAAGDVVSEQGRLNTFRCWPHSAAMGPSVLAKAGFYSLGQGDRVRCAFCAGTLKNWQHGDDPLAEHKRHFPSCRFAQGRDVGNVPLMQSTGTAAVQPSVDIEPGPQQSQGKDVLPEVVGARTLNPRNPEFQSVASRVESFVGWPPDAVQRPPVLVDAGFFYTGNRDGVRCFCCDGSLHNWERDDDPWVEHARWFPRCPYLIQQKGLGYISDIQGRQVVLQESQNARASPHQSPVASRRDMPVEDPTMSSEVVRQVLDMGFDRSQVHSCLQQLLSSSGGQLPQLDQLVNALIGDNTQLPQGSREINVSQVTEPARGAPQGQEETGGDRTLCKVCMDREVAVTFLPCGHLVCCSECAKHVQQCPVCRQRVRASIRTYLC